VSEVSEKTTGQDLAELGIDRVTATADSEEIARIDGAIATLAGSDRTFTAEDVRNLVGDWITKPNLLGARFRYWKKRGRIEFAGHVPATRPSRHAAYIFAWKGATPRKDGH
jgi:hypothetical protein